MSSVDDIFNTIDNLIQNKKYDQAVIFKIFIFLNNLILTYWKFKIEKLNHLIDLSLIALDYYHRYYKLYLG